jgi:ABC-type siderophore export system fused ATPase/permease subunit
MTINELLPILILLFVVFILVYTLTTRILESFEYESKMETLGKIAKAMIERGSNVNIENLMNVLDREKKDKK